MIELRKETVEEFMGLYIDFWQFLFIPSELRIKKKEREFMIHTLSLNARGVDISSKEYVQEIIRRMRLKKSSEVYNYRARLKRKGFLAEEDGSVVVPRSLNVKEIPQETHFSFKVFCEEPTQFKNQRPVREVERMTELHRRTPKPKQPPKLPQYDPSEAYREPDSGEVEERVELPRRELRAVETERYSEQQDPIRELSQAARGIHQQYGYTNRDFTSQAIEDGDHQQWLSQHGEGFATDDRTKLDVERSRSKLPPIPDDDEVGDALGFGGDQKSAADFPGAKDFESDHARERIVPPVRQRNIIDLND